MARHDREERQHRRWLEDAQKHLGRGDLEGALPALLRLPQPLRDELLPRAAVLFREAVHEQHRRGAWGMLGTLAARADAEPGLVVRGVDPDETQATYWPLLWAAGRAREWARAQRLWQPLAETARARAPRLAVAVDSWISTQGAPLPEAVLPALACLPPLDSRLGVEQARPRAPLPPPRSVAEVEGAVLALFALEPFPVFASRVEVWAHEATAEVARGVWELAGQLAARELWLRAAADKGLAVLAEPVSLLSRAAREAGASQGVSALALEALRVVTTRLPQTGISRAAEAEAWCALAQAAALQADVRPWVVQAVSEVRFSGAALPRALRLYEALLALAWEAALWARAFLAWDAHHPEARIAPMWLQEGLRWLIASGTPAFLAWMRTAAPTERTELVECVASTSAPDLVESWVDACWEGAEEELRRVLSGALLILLDRTRDKNAKQKMERMLRGAQSLEEAARIVLEAEGALEEGDALQVLPPEGLRIWRRFASRVLTYRVEFLLVALRHASSDEEAWEVGSRYLDAHEGDSAYIETLQMMDGAGREELSRRVLARWLERRANDVEALAEAAVACGRVGAPCKYSHPVLEAFLLAHAGQQPPAVPSAAVKQAQALAREHHLRLRKRKPSGKKKEASKTPIERAPRPKRKARTKPPPGAEPHQEEKPQTESSHGEGKGRPNEDAR